MSTVTEVELRGPIEAGDREKLLEFLRENAAFKQRKERVLIDYSVYLPDQGIKDRTKDIRLRTTNGASEIIIKTGAWGGEDVRQEYSVKTEASFDLLTQTFCLLGYCEGVLCVRKTDVFDYAGIELAVVEVPDHSYYFEAEIEIQSDEMTVDEARQKIKAVLSELKLTTFSDESYYTYIETLNKEANTHFDAGDVAKDYFETTFSV